MAAKKVAPLSPIKPDCPFELERRQACLVCATGQYPEPDGAHMCEKCGQPVHAFGCGIAQPQTSRDEDRLLCLKCAGEVPAELPQPVQILQDNSCLEDCSKTESGDGLEMETTNRTDVLNFSSLMDDGLVESFLNASEMNDYPTDSTVDVPHQVLAGDRPEQKPSTSCSKPKPRVGGQDSSCTKQAVNKGGNRQPGAKKPTVQKKPADCVVGVPLWVYCRLRESAERNLATIEAELRERSRVVREARLALSHAKSRQHKVRVAYNGAKFVLETLKKME